MERYCHHDFDWKRLAVLPEDFERFSLIPLKPKTKDRRYQSFVERHGTQCAELDALPATELRDRIRSAIEWHIPQAEWDRLMKVLGKQPLTSRNNADGSPALK